MKNKIPFQDWLIEYAEKMNTCHAPSSGQFCSTGGTSGGGNTSKLSPAKRRQAKAELDYLKSPQRNYRLNAYQQQRVRELESMLKQ